jgi:hypothetical protein
MTVYVDDAAIAATVGRIDRPGRTWSPTTRTGCAPSPPVSGYAACGSRTPLTKPRGIRPASGSRVAENWHYHVTARQAGPSHPPRRAADHVAGDGRGHQPPLRGPTMTAAPVQPPITYFGGKTRLGRRIAALLPVTSITSKRSPTRIRSREVVQGDAESDEVDRSAGVLEYRRNAWPVNAPSPGNIAGGVNGHARSRKDCWSGCRRWCPVKVPLSDLSINNTAA